MNSNQKLLDEKKKPNFWELGVIILILVIVPIILLLVVLSIVGITINQLITLENGGLNNTQALVLEIVLILPVAGLMSMVVARFVYNLEKRDREEDTKEIKKVAKDNPDVKIWNDFIDEKVKFLLQNWRQLKNLSHKNNAKPNAIDLFYRELKICIEKSENHPSNFNAKFKESVEYILGFHIREIKKKIYEGSDDNEIEKSWAIIEDRIENLEKYKIVL